VVGIQDTFGKCWIWISAPVKVGQVCESTKLKHFRRGNGTTHTGDGESAMFCRILKSANMRELRSFWEAKRTRYENGDSLDLRRTGHWYEVIQD
jgi:hypothetical protein